MARRTPRVVIFTPTFGDKLRQETVASVGAQEFGGGFTYSIGRHNPYDYGDLRNVTAQYSVARELFLAGTADALMTVEHDMLIPPDALQQLWEVGAPVVYGVYLLRQGLVLNAQKLDGTFYAGRPTADVVEVAGVGLGCTLIRRPALERIAFRPDPRHGTCDATLAADCRQAGIRQMAHFGVACGHIQDNLVLLPYRDAETGMVQAWPT